MRRVLSYGIMVAAVFACASVARLESAEGPKFYPTDEAVQDTSFFEFRESLISAVGDRDYEFLISVVAEDVHINYDGPQGIEAFKKQFGLSDPGSKYWRELAIILSNGGSFEEDRDGRRVFWAPYVKGKWHGNRIRLSLAQDYQWPDDVDEDMEFGVALGDSILLRKQPRIDAPAIRVLSYDLIASPDMVYTNREVKPKRYPGWTRVVTHDGCSGFIPSECYRDWFDYSLQFRRIDGKWKITYFSRGVL